MLDPLYESNSELNQNISLQEIQRIIMSAKNGKSSRIDNIPYDVLKFPSVIPVIRSLFQLIFDTSIIPSLWRKAIIYPILKDPSSDRRIPMNYRGISLLSCISKLYSAFINNRLKTYLEENELLSDEQNGFRAGRSCEDHVFTLTRWVALTESTGSNRLFRRLRDQKRSLREFYLFLHKVAFFPR